MFSAASLRKLKISFWSPLIGKIGVIFIILNYVDFHSIRGQVVGAHRTLKSLHTLRCTYGSAENVIKALEVFSYIPSVVEFFVETVPDVIIPTRDVVPVLNRMKSSLEVAELDFLGDVVCLLTISGS